MGDVGGVENRAPARLTEQNQSLQDATVKTGPKTPFPVDGSLPPSSAPHSSDIPVGPTGLLGQPTGMPIPAGPGPIFPDVLAGRDPSQLAAADLLRTTGGTSMISQMLGLNLQPTITGAMFAPPGNSEALRHMTPEMRRALVRALLDKQRAQMRRLVVLLQDGQDDQPRRERRQDSDDLSDDYPRPDRGTHRGFQQLASAARMLYVLEELLAMQDYAFCRMGTFSKG